MIFAEIFLLELRRGNGRLSGHSQFHHVAAAVGGEAIQVAGDELEARVVEGGAAVVDECDPAVEVGGFVVAGYR